MSVLLHAPYPNIETISLLPNPIFSDLENQKSNVSIRRSMNNVVRTYVKKRTNHDFSYSFRLTRAKALELKAFIESYNRVKILLVNHKDEQWVVNLTNNPFEFNRAGAAHNYPGGEYVTITLEFEGIPNA